MPHLYFMTDSVRTPDPVQLAERLPRGTAVILRHYDTPDRYNLARQLKRVCQERSLNLNYCWGCPSGGYLSADGLHMPEWTITRPQLSHRRWLRLKNRISTAAVHSMPGLHRAYRMGVDAVLVSPVFPTARPPSPAATGVLVCSTRQSSIGSDNSSWRDHRCQRAQVNWNILRRHCRHWGP